MTYPVTKTAPWGHQEEAWNLAKDHEGFLMAHDMGAGKSKVAVDFCTGIGAKLVLILCPKSVIPVWPQQFDLHAGVAYTVLALNNGSVAAKANQARWALDLSRARGERLVIVVNYESAWRPPLGPSYNQKNRLINRGLLLSQKWDAVILDESHRIKSPGGKASWFCSRLRDQAVRRLCLTGTPMPHSPLDIYAQYRFLDPTIFGKSFQRFKMRYAVMGGFNNKQVVGFRNLEELHEKFFSRAHRVTKDEVLDLPPIMHEQRACTLSPKARRVYDDLNYEFVAQVETGEITVANALVKLLRLQQITGGYLPLDDGDGTVIDDSKLSLLADLFEDLPQAEPVVVFTRFRSEIQRIKVLAENLSRPAAELSGSRNELKEWQAGKFNVLVVQIRAGGLGVEFTRAQYVIYYSLGFSLGDYEQSLARAHRPGQKRKVTVYHLIARNTVDEQVYVALRAKKQVVEAILAETKGGLKNENRKAGSRERETTTCRRDYAEGNPRRDRRQERPGEVKCA